ncbi:uncharacterized protein TNCV_615031 [Trichonephila clavipes]|nr:uncharacterized protein TNCV_615031 [Trichonephila clavipes]
MSAADFLRQITEVYGTEAMSDSKVRKWIRNECPDVSLSVVFSIVTENLNLKKLCSRWVPRLLTVEHKEKRFAISLDFLIRYEEEGDDILSRIVTGDETWVSRITPESRQQSVDW